MVDEAADQGTGLLDGVRLGLDGVAAYVYTSTAKALASNWLPASATVKPSRSERIYRELAAARPDAFRCELARYLNNQSIQLGGLGRHDEALAAIEEAVRIYRELAQARPNVFRSDLATLLNCLSTCLSELGRHDEALAVSNEVIRLT
jgi:tetratricopeptide (TPR) repeat protein